MGTTEVTSRASCADAADPSALTVEQARSAIRTALTPITEQQRLAIRSARGRVLAADCVSPIDVPSRCWQ